MFLKNGKNAFFVVRVSLNKIINLQLLILNVYFYYKRLERRYLSLLNLSPAKQKKKKKTTNDKSLILKSLNSIRLLKKVYSIYLMLFFVIFKSTECALIVLKTSEI